jgi:hypothetical protein
MVKIKKPNASNAENTAAADLTSHIKGRKKVAAMLLSANVTGLEALML